MRRRRLLRVPPTSRLASAAVLLAAACASGPSAGDSIAGPAIVIDGSFDDWSGVPVALVDPIGDATGALDIGELRVTHDREAIFLRIDLAVDVNLQGLGETLFIALDADCDAGTGRTFATLHGVDVIVEFSPPGTGGGENAGAGLRIPSGTASRASDILESAYALGVVFAPTHASRRFEVRIDRDRRAGNSPAMGTGSAMRLLVAAGTPGEAGGGDFSDTTASVTERLPDAPARADRGFASDPLLRPDGVSIRVLAWNVADDGLLARPGPFTRILSAIAPDVMLLDEISAAVTREGLVALLEAVEGGPWNVVLGQAGGRQRTAVISRFALEAAEALAHVAWPDSVEAVVRLTTNRQMIIDMSTASRDGIPTMGAVASIEGSRILFVPVDLQCCGRTGNPEDRSRIIQADAINRAALRAASDGRVDGVVIGGDFNLVGSYAPVDRMARALDPDGSDLASAFPLRLDGRTATTWRAPGPFTPGRLDYVLFSRSSLEAVRSFVFDAADLTGRWRRESGLRADDSDIASDHLPVVVDLRLRQRG